VAELPKRVVRKLEERFPDARSRRVGLALLLQPPASARPRYGRVWEQPPLLSADNPARCPALREMFRQTAALSRLDDTDKAG